MATNEHIIKAPGMMKNLAVGGHLTTADQIIDESLNKDQKVINQEAIAANIAERNRAEAAESVLDGKIDAEITRAGNTEGALQVDIDDVEDDLRALEVVVQSEQMQIGATVFDTYPQLNSNHPVTSDGIYRKNIEAEIVVGDPQGDWSPSEAEAAYERFQGNLDLMQAEINAAQLEIGAVQTDLAPTEDSPNMLPSGAVYNTCAVVGDKVGEV